MTPSGSGKRPGWVRRGKPKKRDWPFAQYYPVVIGALGLLTYGAVRDAYDAYYGSLGVTPDEAGVTYVVIVTRAALGLVLAMTVLVLTYAVAAYALGHRVGARWVRTQIRRPWPIPLVAVVFVIVVWIKAHEALSYVTERQPRRLVALAVIVVVAAVSTSALGRSTSVPSSKRKRAVGWSARKLHLPAPDSGSSHALALALLAVCAIAADLVVSTTWGDYQASLVAQGKSIRSATPFGIFALQARPVCVLWDAGKNPVPANDNPLFYLGSANSTALLYAPKGWSGDQAVYRVPASEVVLTAPQGGRAVKLVHAKSCLSSIVHAGAKTPPSNGSGAEVPPTPGAPSTTTVTETTVNGGATTSSTTTITINNSTSNVAPSGTGSIGLPGPKGDPGKKGKPGPAGVIGPPAAALRVGSSGYTVKLWQTWLNRWEKSRGSHLRLGVDGQYGSKTAAVTRSFQTHAGFKATGVVGAHTWLKLQTTLRG